MGHRFALLIGDYDFKVSCSATLGMAHEVHFGDSAELYQISLIVLNVVD